MIKKMGIKSTAISEPQHQILYLKRQIESAKSLITDARAKLEARNRRDAQIIAANQRLTEQYKRAIRAYRSNVVSLNRRFDS